MVTAAETMRILEARKAGLATQITSLTATYNDLINKSKGVDAAIVRLQGEVRALEATIADLRLKIADIKTRYGL